MTWQLKLETIVLLPENWVMTDFRILPKVAGLGVTLRNSPAEKVYSTRNVGVLTEARRRGGEGTQCLVYQLGIWHFQVIDHAIERPRSIQLAIPSSLGSLSGFHE